MYIPNIPAAMSYHECAFITIRIVNERHYSSTIEIIKLLLCLQ